MTIPSWECVLLNKAIQFLARRSHTEAELKAKLWRAFSNKSHPRHISGSTLNPIELQEKIQKTIEYCRQHQWLNDKAFVNAYYAMRQRNGYGHQRILLELKARGISKEIRDSLISTEESDENVTAIVNKIKKKYGSIDKADLKQKQKIYRFLLARGFSWEVANHVYFLIKN